MKKRLISACIMIVIAVSLLLIGGAVLEIGVGLLSLYALTEFMDAKKDVKIPNFMKILACIALVFLIYDGIDSRSIVLGISYTYTCLTYILMLIPSLFLNKYKYGTKEAFYLASITIFIGLFANLFLTIYHTSNMLIYYLLIIPIITDTFAYFGGKLIGRHKFTKISPNKTVEGCIIGLIFGVASGTLFYLYAFDPIPIIKIILVSTVLSISGQVGDLFFSLIKRESDIKDFSNLIPGHGGLLDRIDSYTFVIIVFAFLYRFL